MVIWKAPALQRGDPFVDQLPPAVDEPRFFGAVLQRAARNFVVVCFVGLAEIGGVGVGNRALAAHPVKRGARVEAAGKCDADFLAGGNTLKNRRHVVVKDIKFTSRRALGACYDFWSECAPVAQLDRATGFEPVGRRFESCRAHQSSLKRRGKTRRVLRNAATSMSSAIRKCARSSAG